MSIIPYSHVFDQQTMTHMLDYDALVQRYRTFFSLFDWRVVPEPVIDPSRPGHRPHPQSAYIKALLLKLQEGLVSCTRLRQYLVEHPLLVLELGFRPVSDSTQPDGFDVQRTVPTSRWFSEQQRTLSQGVLLTLRLAHRRGLARGNPWARRGRLLRCDPSLRVGAREQSPRLRPRHL